MHVSITGKQLISKIRKILVYSLNKKICRNRNNLRSGNNFRIGNESILGKIK